MLGLLLFHPYFSPPAGQAGWKVSLRSFPYRRLIAGDVLSAEAAALRRFAGHLSDQDRSYFVYRHRDFSFMPKSAQLFGLPTVQDYEPQPGRRHAEFHTMLRTGVPLWSLNQVYFQSIVAEDPPAAA